MRQVGMTSLALEPSVLQQGSHHQGHYKNWVSSVSQDTRIHPWGPPPSIEVQLALMAALADFNCESCIALDGANQMLSFGKSEFPSLRCSLLDVSSGDRVSWGYGADLTTHVQMESVGLPNTDKAALCHQRREGRAGRYQGATRRASGESSPH